MPCRKKSLIRNEEAGFTLLEIIAVMVIMSILAVVAVPKYFDLQAQAKSRAMDTAMAEAVGRVNSYFAQQVLSGIDPSTIAYTAANLGSDLGDFTLTVTDNLHLATGTPTCSASGIAGCIDLTITANAGTAVAGADPKTRHIPRPGSL